MAWMAHQARMGRTPLSLALQATLAPRASLVLRVSLALRASVGCLVSRVLKGRRGPGVSLARDAGILVRDHGFRLVAAGVMDMFPHTTHVEAMAVFDR